LDDPVFIEPFRVHFDPIIGWPSIPIDTYLRLMFLKFRYRLAYELLCREVADSISWQRFSRIPLGGRMPHPTTLVKLTRQVGEQAVDGLNQALLARRPTSWPRPSNASRPPGARPAPGSGTAATPRTAAPTRSPGRCGRALVRPSRSCSRSPGRSPGWPRRS
jgi:hypothetical protein